MNELLITPGFSMTGGQNQITFAADSVNHLQRAEYLDSWDFFQQTYGLYSFMRLSKRLEYNLHTISGSPLIWQPFNTCEFSPGNNVRAKKTTFTPDRVKLNERFCHDDLFNSCFEQLINYGDSAGVELDAEGVRMVNEILQEVMYQSQVSARALLATGGLYDVNAGGFDFGATPADQIALFKAVYQTTSGWLTGFADLASAGVAPHLNIAGVFNPGNITAANYTAGGFQAIHDAVRAGAPKALLNLINKGPGTTNKGRRIGAVGVATPAVYTWLVNSEIAESAQVATNKMRISKTMINNNGQGAPTYVYSIDGMPVICADELGTFDQYMAGDTYGYFIVASGNIQLGMSFDSLSPANPAAILVEQSMRAHDYGTVYYLAHALFKAVLADHNLAAGSFVRHEL